MRNLIIDTDIGIDCDDALALAVALALERKGKIRLNGVSVCTAREGAPASVHAIGRYFGRTFDVSRYGGKTLECDSVNVYASALRERFGFAEAKEDGVRFLRRKLAEAEGKVTLASIGPFSNLSALLESGADDLSPLCGSDLVARKVDVLFSMGGNFTHLCSGERSAEWNVEQDIESCRLVAERWASEIVFVPYEVGCNVLSGSVFGENDPVGYAVKLFFDANPGEFCGTYARSSWDPITVCEASGVRLFNRSEYGTVTVERDGVTSFKAGAGRHRYLTPREDRKLTAAKLDALYSELLQS